MTLPSKSPEFPSAISLDTSTTLTSNLKVRVENKEQLNCQFSWKDQFGSVDGCWKDEETKVVKMTRLKLLTICLYTLYIRVLHHVIHTVQIMYIAA